MTTRDFLILMIKLFGLYSAVTIVFSVLPNNLFFSLGHMDAFAGVWLMLVLVITIGLFWLLTFKADKIVDFFKLENGFTNDKIELGSIKSEDIVKTGVFIIGGLLFLNNLPGFLSNVFWAFKGEAAGYEFNQNNNFNLTVSGLNVMIGYLLFTNYDSVANRIKGKREEK